VIRNRFVPAVELPDGSRTAFTTQSSYLAGTLRVLLSGRFLEAALDNGFLEGSPPAFEMKVAPRTGETLWTFYREA
jgi:hypothetical protein